MTETSEDLVANLIVGHKSDGRCVYDKTAKRQLAQRCLQPGVSLARTSVALTLNYFCLNVRPTFPPIWGIRLEICVYRLKAFPGTLSVTY